MPKYLPPYLRNSTNSAAAVTTTTTRPVLNSVVAIITRKNNVTNAIELLMQRRGLTMRYDPGLVECPGGRIDKNETPEHACLREIAEECGDAIRNALTGFTFVTTVQKELWEDICPTGGEVHIYTAEIDYATSLQPSMKPKPHAKFRTEVIEHKWVPFADVPTMNQNEYCGEFSGYTSHMVEFWKAAVLNNDNDSDREAALNAAKIKSKTLKEERAKATYLKSKV